jgi:hypothetical protein
MHLVSVRLRGPSPPGVLLSEGKFCLWRSWLTKSLAGGVRVFLCFAHQRRGGDQVEALRPGLASRSFLALATSQIIPSTSSVPVGPCSPDIKLSMNMPGTSSSSMLPASPIMRIDISMAVSLAGSNILSWVCLDGVGRTSDTIKHNKKRVRCVRGHYERSVSPRGPS